MTPYKYAQIGETTLAYRRAGTGPTMILLHGVGSFSQIWEGMIPLLSGRFEVIAPDLLGCGRSSKPETGAYGIRGQRELIQSLLDQLAVNEFHVVAHDVGGGIAQLLAVELQEQLNGLTLINPVGYDYWPIPSIVTLRLPLMRQLTMALMDRSLYATMLRRGVAHPERLTQEVLDSFREPFHTLEGRKGLMRLLRALDSKDLVPAVDRLGSIHKPVLLIRAEQDRYLSPEILARMNRDIPGSRLVELPGAGHFAQIDQPEALAALVLAHATAKDPSNE